MWSIKTCKECDYFIHIGSKHNFGICSCINTPDDVDFANREKPRVYSGFGCIHWKQKPTYIPINITK